MQECFTGARDEKLRYENAYIRGPLRIVMFLHADMQTTTRVCHTVDVLLEN